MYRIREELAHELALAFAWRADDPNVAWVRDGGGFARVFADEMNCVELGDAFNEGGPSFSSRKCETGRTNIEWASEFLTTSDGAGTGDFSLAVIATPGAAGGSVEHLFAHKNDAGGSPFAQAALMAHSNAGSYAADRMEFFTYSGAGTAVNHVASIDGATHLWVGVRSVSDHVLYRDGVSVASGVGTARDLTQSSSRYTAIGSRGNGTTEASAGRIALALAFNSALSFDDIQRLNADPRGLWLPFATPLHDLYDADDAVSSTFQAAWAVGANVVFQSAGAVHA